MEAPLGLFWTILWYLGVAIAVLFLFLVVAAIILIITMIYQLEKFMFGLPWLKWLTLNDLQQLGFSKTWARLILPAFHERGYLEVRLADEDNMDDLDHEMVDRFGFSVATVPLYEFKLTKRKGRRRKWSMSDLSGLTKTWRPS